MTWGSTIGTAFVTAIAGAAAAGYLGYLCEDWYRISSHELGRGVFAISTGVVGLIVGFVAGIIIARIIPAFWTAQAASLGLVVGLCAIIGFFARMYGEVAPELDGDRLMLHLELKCPRGWKPDNKSPSSCWLVPPSQYGSLGKPAEVDAQWVAPCAVMLVSSRPERSVRVILGENTDVTLPLPLPPNPGNELKQWTQWFPEKSGYTYRVRIQRMSDLKKEEEAERVAIEQARQQALAAIPSDAPLERWLPFFEDWDRDRHKPANDAVEARPLELIPLLESPDKNTMRLAVLAAAQLRSIPAPLIDSLATAGHLTIDLIKESEAQKAEEYFIKWNQAMNIAQANAQQFRPMLEQIEREASSSTTGPISEIARTARQQLETLAK